MALRKIETSFDYTEAFSRNLGWITEDESVQLSKVKVAIAGMGGVGGHYAEVLTRLGIQRFHLADFDKFEIGNFNRQNGALTSTIGKPKIDVIADRILQINPNAEITKFSDGLNNENMSSFVKDTDLYCDGLDFFVLELREKLFRTLRENNIPAITVAPIGMGAALLVFDKDSMSFDDYFGMDKVDSIKEKALRFLLGLSPSMQQSTYLVEKSRMDFEKQKAPSLPMGCYLCGGVLGSTALKILLHRGRVYKAPHSLHYDIFNNTLIHKRVYFGYRNPFQFLKRMLLTRALK
jgi:molybdopterin/thiamine biosynthesis adenylyltransferase